MIRAEMGRRTPPAYLALRLLVKSTIFWLLIRASLLALGVPQPLAQVSVPGPTPLASVGVIAVVLAMLWADMALLRERIFLEDLGVGRMGVLRFAGAWIAVLEIAWQVAARTQGL